MVKTETCVNSENQLAVFRLITILTELCHVIILVGHSSSFYWASVGNAPNVLQPYWLIVLPLDVPNLTASLLL